MKLIKDKGGNILLAEKIGSMTEEILTFINENDINKMKKEQGNEEDMELAFFIETITGDDSTFYKGDDYIIYDRINNTKLNITDVTKKYRHLEYIKEEWVATDESAICILDAFDYLQTYNFLTSSLAVFPNMTLEEISHKYYQEWELDGEKFDTAEDFLQYLKILEEDSGDITINEYGVIIDVLQV